MKKIIGAIFLLVVVIGVSFILFKNTNSPQDNIQKTTPISQANKEISFTASFAIYTNGTFRIFADSKYHNLSEEVFIREGNANVIYVKKDGVTWDDFFKTLPMSLTEDCLITGTGQKFCTQGKSQLKFYLNGRKVSNFLDTKIKSNDEALISYGSENEEEIKVQLEELSKIE